MFTVEWIAELTRFAELAREWSALLPKGAYPFDAHGWYEAWWKAFGGSGSLAVCTVRRDDKLVGALPMRADGARLEGLANSHSCMFRPLATDEEAMAALTAAALGRPAAELELCLLPSEDGSLAALEDAGRKEHRLQLWEPGPTSPIVDTDGDVEAWRKGEKSSWKARLARYRRKMERDHDAQLEIVVAPDDLDAWLEQGFRLEASGWKGRAGTAIDSTVDTAAFYRDVAHRFHARGELRLSRILLDGEAVAFSLCILEGNKLYSLKAGYDESWRKLVPGLVLQLSIIERCFELGLDAYELLGESTEWKQKLATDSRSFTNLHVYPRHPVGIARYGYRAGVRPRLRSAYRRFGSRSR